MLCWSIRKSISTIKAVGVNRPYKAVLMVPGRSLSIATLEEKPGLPVGAPRPPCRILLSRLAQGESGAYNPATVS